MDLQARKLNLIQEFLRINSEELITKLDNFLHTEKRRIYEQEFKANVNGQFYCRYRPVRR